MIKENLKSRADFVTCTDETGKQVLETSRSSVLVPRVKWNGLGIKWYEEDRKGN